MIKRVDKGEASRFGSCQRPLLATTGNRSSKPKRTAKQIKSQREYIVLMLKKSGTECVRGEIPERGCFGTSRWRA